MKRILFFFFTLCSLTIFAQNVSKPTLTSSRTLKSKTFKVKNVSFKMVEVEGGTFTMGTTSEQSSDVMEDEIPAHTVTLDSYCIGKTEVTQALWKAVMGNNPSQFKGNNRPVESVSWNDCQKFISKLNTITGKHFRLPTEAEWEFAARGGVQSKNHKFSGSNTLEDVAWIESNSGSTTHDVATKQANELGIYDMSGNVFEWCSDWYGNYDASPQKNPKGPAKGENRVFRGGSWIFGIPESRVSCRGCDDPNDGGFGLGLRLAL